MKEQNKPQKTKKPDNKLLAFFKKAIIFIKMQFTLLMLKSPVLSYYRSRYTLWMNSIRLKRAIKLCDAKTSAYNRQYHVFKIRNKYFIQCRLDFKLSKNLSQKAKDRINVIKVRESAIYSSPLTLLKNNLPVKNLRT